MTSSDRLVLLALGRCLDSLFRAYSELETAHALAADSSPLASDVTILLAGVRGEAEAVAAVLCRNAEH